MGQQKQSKTVKRYYWLKLKEEFFQDKEVKKLRKIAGGDTYTVIYLKLMLLSLKSDGRLYFDGVEDTFHEELALEIDEDAENVRVTLMYLEKMGLLQLVNDDEIFLTQMDSLIFSESESAQRVREHRAKKKSLPCGEVPQENLLETSGDTEEKELNDEEVEGKKPSSNEERDFGKHTNVENAMYILSYTNYEHKDWLNSNMIILDCLREWLEYKDGRSPKSSNHYNTAIGLVKLMNKFVESAKKYGNQAVLNVVDYSITENYMGVLWDRLSKFKPIEQIPKANVYPPQKSVEDEPSEEWTKQFEDA